MKCKWVVRKKKIRGDHVGEIITIPFNIYFISLRSIFKVFFERPNVFKTITNYLKVLYSANGNIVSSFVQVNDNWILKRINNPNKLIIPYILFFDDYETNNPLGTHTAGIQKLGAIYISH